MKALVLIGVLLPASLLAQDATTFRKAIESGKVERLDRWMKRTIHDQCKGHLVINGTSTYITHQATYDTIVAFVRQQPGVIDAAWDRCVAKAAIWPGHSVVGIMCQMGGRTVERCWRVQEGRLGTIRLGRWRPRIRKPREELRYLGAQECTGFVAEQRKLCEAKE